MKMADRCAQLIGLMADAPGILDVSSGRVQVDVKTFNELLMQEIPMPVPTLEWYNGTVHAAANLASVNINITTVLSS